MPLTDQELNAIRAVANGADVYLKPLASVLRRLEKRKYVEIVKPQMYRGNGADQVPYFGAIATRKGLKELGVM